MALNQLSWAYQFGPSVALYKAIKACLSALTMSGSGIGMAVGVGVPALGTGCECAGELPAGATVVAVSGAGVAVGGLGVAVGGADVAVGGADVVVGGADVAVGGSAVGGADVAVGDAGIAVAVGCGSASGAGLRHAAIVSVNRSERHAIANNLMGAGKAFIP